MDIQNDKFPDVIGLNVGGHLYTTTLETLRKYPHSKLAAIFSNYKDIPRDKEGNFFIDRNGKHFEHILDFLRDEECLPPLKGYKAVLREAHFYDIHKLVKILETKYDFSAQFPNITPGYHAIKEKVFRFGMKSALVIRLENASSSRPWDKIYSSSWYQYYKCGSLQVTCDSSDEAHNLISCLWKELSHDGFEVEMKIQEFRFYVICMFAVESEKVFSV